MSKKKSPPIHPQSEVVPSERQLRYEARSRVLDTYLHAVEDFFPYIAARFKTEQYSEHAANVKEYFPEELEIEREELRQHLLGPLPRSIRGSALVVIFSTFESTTMDFAAELTHELGCASFLPVSGRGSFINKASKHFTQVFDVSLFSNQREQKDIETLGSLRNSFAHRLSTFSRMDEKLRKRINESESQLVRGIAHDDIWVPSMDCVFAHGSLVSGWARRLSERVFDRIGIIAL